MARENPFMCVTKGSTVNKSRDFQVPAEWTERILEACPNQSLRALFALWRHAGLRFSEPFFLKRSSINLKTKRLSVYAPKTERYESGGLRETPISPLLARELVARLEELPDDAENLFRTQENAALAKAFGKVLSKAGLEPWEKLFQNLRSSCENDWIAQGIPAHVVAARTRNFGIPATRRRLITLEFCPSISNALRNSNDRFVFAKKKQGLLGSI